MIKHILHFLFIIFVCINTSYGETISMDWLNSDDTIYQTTTCNAGEDVILPPPPEKRGYTFKGWEGYTLLEYIESVNQTSVIHTGIIMTEGDYKFKTKITPKSGGTGGLTIAGNIVTAATPRGLGYGFYGGGTVNGKIVPSIANVTYGAANGIPYPNSMIGTTVEFTSEYDNTNKILSISDSEHTYYTNVTGNPVWNVEFLLFSGYTVSSAGFVGRMYYATLIKDEEIILNVIPAKRHSDNKVGMLDLVSNQFFTNQGTGEFIAGPAIGE